jgi:hypothetical protein
MRLYRVTFVAGLGAGYVLGTRAGRERFDQLRKLFRSAADNPAVQQTAGALHAQATSMMKSACGAAAAGGRRGASRIIGRNSATGQGGAGGKSAADRASTANGDEATSGKDSHRPFVPANGDLGDHRPS